MRFFVVSIFAAIFVVSAFLFGANTLEGEKLFITKCGKCHVQGGEARPVNPKKYSAENWKRFFDRYKHQRKKDISNVVSERDQQLILEYLMKNGADSNSSQEAGI